ncbi:glycosyltransferase [Colwellia sp. MEBiC06753]
MDILIITDNRFWRQSLGSQQRIFALMSYLNQFSTLTIYFIGEPSEDDRALISTLDMAVIISQELTEEEFSFIDSYRFAKSFCALAINKLKKIINKPRRFTPSLNHYIKHHEMKKLRAFINNKRFDATIVEYLRLSYLMPIASSKSKLSIIDTHDVSFLRHIAFNKNNAADDLQVSKQEEIAILKNFDATLAIQQEDQRTYQNEGVTNVIYTPHAVEFYQLPPNVTGKLKLGFLGSTMSSNVDGINWFLKSILPSIEAKHVEVYIAGSVCKYIEDVPQNVYLLGFVEKLSDYYNNIDISINPIRFGSGLKIKSVESICHNRPLISTNYGVEGMPDNDDSPFIVCNQINEWVDTLNKCQSVNLMRQLTNNCETYAKQHYSIQACYSNLKTFLTEDTLN